MVLSHLYPQLKLSVCTEGTPEPGSAKAPRNVLLLLNIYAEDSFKLFPYMNLFFNYYLLQFVLHTAYT